MAKELNTIYSFKEQLSTAISGGGSEPSRFADLLIEKKLIDNSRAINILSTTGVGGCVDLLINSFLFLFCSGSTRSSWNERE